jgi:alcohol dehydrogenase
LDDEKLAFAKTIGAVATINARHTPDVVGTIQEITKGGAHVSMDALGSPVTCYNSIACLRRRGRHVQAGLMTGNHASPKIPMAKVIAHELQVLGTHGMQAHRYDAMFAMINASKLAPQKLVQNRITLDQAPAALMALDQFDGVGISVIDRF